MLNILSRIGDYYFTLEELSSMIKEEIDKLLPRLTGKKFLTTFSKSSDESTQFWSYLSKRLSEERIHFHSISEIKKRIKKMVKTEEISIILIDDVIGTGSQFIDNYRDNFENFIQAIKEPFKEKVNLYLITAIISVDSYRAIIKNTILNEGQIYYVKIISKEKRAFYPTHFKNQVEKLNKLKQFLKSIHPNHWDGWKKTETEPGPEYLVVFQWNTPNSTIGCLWYDIPGKWFTLFPRAKS